MNDCREYPAMRLDERLEKLEVSDPYRAFFMRSADANLILQAGHFIDCNEATTKMLCYESKSALFERHPAQLSPKTQPDGRNSFEKANEMMELAFERGSHRFEWDHIRADGEVFPVEVLLTTISQRDRKLLHVVWRDITERRQLEEQLRHAQKMEAIGKLAGGIAHDFNNLLVAILGNCDLLEKQIGERSALQTRVGRIREAGNRATVLTRGLLAFSRKQVMHNQVLDLNKVVFELNQLLRRLIGDDVEMRCVLTDEIVRIRADRGQLDQVIVNLVTNARDAMPRGGSLRVETRRIELTEDTIGLGEGLNAGHYALLTVSDTGSGMDDAVVRRAFDPFFTTKPVGKGTGLGLSTVYGIVKQSGAEISIFSVPERGTTVKVYFPLTNDSLASDKPTASEPPARGGTETIVVAEDEPMVSSVIATVLQDAGYQVLVAEDGEEAFRKICSLNERVDLLLTDVMMPNLNGPELVSKLNAAEISPKVLFASGYAMAALTQENVVPDHFDIIEKPFSAQVLLRRIRSILDR